MINTSKKVQCSLEAGHRHFQEISSHSHLLKAQKASRGHSHGTLEGLFEGLPARRCIFVPGDTLSNKYRNGTLKVKINMVSPEFRMSPKTVGI
jgi:hypothetical protein